MQEELEANGEQVDYAFRVTYEVHLNLLKLSVRGVHVELEINVGGFWSHQ